MQILRVFISSPGDVGEERGLARRLLKDELPFDPLIRGLVHLDPISWDDPTAPTPLPANLTPQEALIRFGPKPSQCDIVVVILWSRLGTHLDISAFRKPNGDRYLSGTEWEYEDAWNNPQPDILVYRRMEVPKFGANDPKIVEKIRQYELVGAFFDRFENRDGSSRSGWAPYDTPTGFRDRLETDLKSILRERLDGNRTLSDPEVPVWGGSPYPGLRTFTFNEASIFFGRGREVDALVAMMRDTARRFIAILGASGTGKSSIIRAGLLPRLATGAIEGSQHWHLVSITPGTSNGNPLFALLDELRKIPSALAKKSQFENPMAPGGNPRKSLVDEIMALLANDPARDELLLFVDQFEEVFTLVSAENRSAFLNLLNRMIHEFRLRVLATVRTDFLSKCTANPDLAELLQTGSFVLGAPGPAALVEIIRKPAERAGLGVEDALVNAILNEAGGDPGALPLIAFCLEELYRQAAPGRQMTLEAFKDLGRLQGAISRRAGALLGPLRHSDKEKVDTALARLFQALINVDASGSASRRWASADDLSALEPLLTELIRGRLLVADEVEGRATITLAHEALIREWPDLKRWLDANTKKLRRVQRALDGLEEHEPTDRRNAISILLEIGTSNVKVVPALLGALDDADQKVRNRASNALGRLGHLETDVVAALIDTLSQERERVIEGAALALGQIGPAATSSVQALTRVLQNTAPDVREAGAEALGLIGLGTPEVILGLIALLRDPVSDVRNKVSEALGRLGSAAVEASDELIRVANSDESGQVRGMAAVALQRVQQN